MNERPPWPVLTVAFVLIVASMALIGALWSGSATGREFAEGLTGSYESNWLAWGSACVWFGCGAFMLFRNRFSRILYLVWSAFGIIEGLVLTEETHFSLPGLILFAVTAALLFTPPANAWFRET